MTPVHDSGVLRRLVLTVVVIVGASAATRLLASILAADGLSLPEVAILILFCLTFGWISVAFWTALAGFIRVLVAGGVPRPGAGLREPAPDAPIDTRTALIMPVYHEDTEAIGERIAATYRSLERTGHLDRFDFFILSDSRRPEIAAAEEALWARLCGQLRACGRLFYRRRTDNRGRKSGNVADFCRRWGAHYDFFVVLDADSVMTGPTLVRLVRSMQANPRAGLIQTVPRPVRGETLFARLQQFAAALYSPLFAVGTAYWFPGKSSYWGHNAIIRTSAFTACCGLPALSGRPPLGGEILSHDFVEAALLRRGGWEVWLDPALGGSFEELPPTLADYAKRDRRWCQGNLQHTKLLRAKGLCPVSRLHLAMGAVAYLAAPFWFLLLLLTTLAAMHADPSDWVYFPDAGSLFPVWPMPRAVELIGLFTATMTMLLLPKVLALMLALADPQQRRAFGGAGRLAGGVAVEIVFAALLAPVLMVRQTAAVLGTLCGGHVSWAGQQRSSSGTSCWSTAVLYADVTVLGVAWGALAYWYTPGLLVWLTPVLAGLVLSVPLAHLSGCPRLGARARRAGWFVIPEETAPPEELAALPPLLDVDGAATDAGHDAPAGKALAGVGR